MTREIIRQIERDYWAEKADPIDMSEIFDFAQKALEQEPCCNCIQFKRYAKEMGFEIEQEPKSEWEHDHEILKAYSDGANGVLDKIRAEIEELDGRYVIGDYGIYGENNPKYVRFREVLEIIDKYKGESGDKV